MRELGTETFSGGTDPLVADNWRKILERNFESMRCPVEFRRELAVHYLRDATLAWCEGVARGASVGFVIPWTVF